MKTESITNWELGYTEPQVQFFPKIFEFLGYSPIQETKSFGDRIRQLRISKGLSRRKFAKVTGLDESTIYNIEMGTRDKMPERYQRVLNGMVSLKMR